MFDKFGIQGFADSKLLYEDRYFYNTDYHLTREGVALKTNIYNEQLYKLLNGS